ncbi:MAG: response regulator transcription factor [Chitinophagaceae bacterium]|nr:response regulator transcription factor [Chitinophagaceae bacterium]
MLKSIAVIEDDDQIRNSLVEQMRLNMNVDNITEFSNGEEAIKELSANPVEIAMFDIQLPGIDGIECIRKLKFIHPRMQFMVLTVYDNADTIFKALRAGANSYILKSTPPERIIEAINELYNGGSPISSEIARKVIAAFQLKENGNEFFQHLSKREQEMLEQLSHGFRYKEIADNLFVSTETVRTHIRNIYEKLQVNSRIEALKKTGLI